MIFLKRVMLTVITSAISSFSFLLLPAGISLKFRAVEAKDALATFQVADGFKIEMIASEPLVDGSGGYGDRRVRPPVCS
jgi:hypothetical protein